MKLCPTCDQLLAETISICPSCGEEVDGGRQYIDDYKIIEVLFEGHASIFCRAIKEDSDTPVMIRLYKSQSEINDQVAERLKSRLQHLEHLPEKGFVRHYEINKSSNGLWYRVSEWVDGEDWSRLFASGLLKDHRVIFDLFYQIAYNLSILHESGHFIPHLVLNDIIIIKGENHKLEVKIDFKLSRFLKAIPQLPGTMLGNLIKCHPDIVNNKPLDFKSDIWSLGRIFVTLLTANLNGSPSLEDIENLPILQEGKTLLKIMLAEDPSMRPRSMKDVADYLIQIKDMKVTSTKKGRLEKVGGPFRELQKLRLRIWGLSAVLGVVFIAGLIGVIYFEFFKKDVETLFQEYANLYSDSVAFVMVSYSLVQNETILYQKRAEGTAFLVDEAGYLITNRHVAAPWLMDKDLSIIIDQMQRQGIELQFDYRMYLWFEGQKAYKRLPSQDVVFELNDIYFLESAFRSDGKPRVTIAGMLRTSIQQGYVFRSPLKDDFAVLKIDEVPGGLTPLPLDQNMVSREIKKLSPIITIGFPLGSRTQVDSVNVSVTKGNVRRTFRDMIQVDISIYKGNSGGPIIDINGKVIGIATGVIMDKTIGIIPIITPLSDIGMVLPISKTLPFLKELKKGQVKWNGVLDLRLEKKVEKIQDMAFRGNWHLAMEMADNELRYSLEPALFMTAGMMHFCVRDYIGAKYFFKQAASMDAENHVVKLMTYIVDWINDETVNNPFRKQLRSLNWRSNTEFYGYLTRILEGDEPPESALNGWNTESEKSWVYYIVASVLYKKGHNERAEMLMKTAARTADKNSWILYLILADLYHMYDQRLVLTRLDQQKKELQGEIQRFYETVLEAQFSRKNRLDNILPLFSRLLHPGIGITDKRSILGRLRELDPNNKETILALAFFSAMDDEWEAAQKHVRDFMEKGSRESKAYLNMKILELGINQKMGIGRNSSKDAVRLLHDQLKDPWYKSICKTLLKEKSETQLSDEAFTAPENIISAHFALGLWAEGSGDKEKAVRHYREVLGTYLEGWWEYEFAKVRVRKLRSIQTSAGESN